MLLEKIGEKIVKMDHEEFIETLIKWILITHKLLGYELDGIHPPINKDNLKAILLSKPQKRNIKQLYHLCLSDVPLNFHYHLVDFLHQLFYRYGDI
jgi:hypothetical protein